MNLIEFYDAVPKKVGKAVIKMSPGEYTRRDGNTIWVAANSQGTYDFRLLCNGNQILIAVNDGYSDAYFAGTDEQPFCVRLSLPFATFSKLIDGEGEAAFYEYLKPDRLRHLEDKYGIKARRQGDIFAFPIRDYQMHQLAQFYDLAFGPSYVFTEETLSIFGTRHTFEGLLLRYQESRSAHPQLIVAEGSLIAPDHAPMHIKEPHILFQTAHLSDAQNAD